MVTEDIEDKNSLNNEEREILINADTGMLKLPINIYASRKSRRKPISMVWRHST